MNDNQNNPTQPNTATPEPAPAVTPTPETPASAPTPESTVPTPATEQPTPASTEPATSTGTTETKPMDPKTKKTIITLCVIGVVVVTLTVLAVIFLPIIFKVDYGESYKKAKQVDEKIDALVYNSDCDRVVNYYDDVYYTNKEFNGYVESCLASTEGLSDLVNELGETSGVKRNNEILELYTGFKESFDKLAINSDSLKSKLEIYKTWHSFEVAQYDLNGNSTDSSYNTAGNILIQSGNEQLKNYGTRWLELALAMSKAYKIWYDADWDNGYYEKRNAYYDAEEAFESYVKNEEPDITEIAPINLENISAVSTRFQGLFSKIAEVYAENYDISSGDCTEYLGKVNCAI